MKLVFFGAGYCSRFIIQNLKRSCEVICTHKVNIKAEKFDKKFNVKRFTFKELTKKKLLLNNVTHIINSIPPVETGDLVYDFINSLDRKILIKLKWFGYLSSTSVYGNHNGKWVDEKTEASPTTTRGKKRFSVENLFMESFRKKNFPTHIFRLPGIYGPGRSIIDKFLGDNKRVIKLENHYFSRVHVEDIASAISKSIEIPTPGQIFNVTDDLPCSAHEVAEYASKLLNIKNIEYLKISSSKINERVKDFYRDNKRVSNQKIKKILNWTPKFENYKLGLNNVLESTNG